MESIAEGDEIFISNQPIPPKYQTTVAIRIKEEKKGKTHAKTSGQQQVRKKKKTKKHASDASPKNVRKYTIFTIDDGDNEGGEHPQLTIKTTEQTNKNLPGKSLEKGN